MEQIHTQRANQYDSVLMQSPSKSHNSFVQLYADVTTLQLKPGIKTRY